MDEPLVETELADSEPQRRRGPWKLIVIVAVLTLIGVWLVPGDGPDEDATVANAPTTDAAPPPVTAPSLLGAPPVTATDTAIGAVPIEAVDDRPGAKARALIAAMRASGEIRSDEIFAAGRQAQAAGELPDAYLLYFFAAREGHGAAALTLGMQADPASRDPANSVFEAPDLTQAHKWYQVAADNGNEEGREHLADLRKRVDQLAAGGDTQAQRISLLWQ